MGDNSTSTVNSVGDNLDITSPELVLCFLLSELGFCFALTIFMKLKVFKRDYSPETC